MKKSLKQIFKEINQLSDEFYNQIQYWDVFSKSIIGQNLITALDQSSINLGYATISQTNANRKKYLNLVLKNLFETNIWLDKARRRQLFDRQNYQNFYTLLNQLQKIINQYLIFN